MLGMFFYIFILFNSSTTYEKHEEIVVQNPIYDKALSLLNTMDIETKVGQMFIMRCPLEKPFETIKKYKLGGYIMFSRDFENKTPQESIETIAEFQNNSNIPLFIAVDEEGGTVNRISKHKQFRSSPFLSPQELYKLGGLDAIESDTLEKSIFLKQLGINLNLAPVADISTNVSDYMYNRTFGNDAIATSEYIDIVIKTMLGNQLGSTLKHFPGYGKNLDTHEYQAIDNREYSSFVNNDFIPFKTGIDSGATAVMVSHTIVSCMDSKNPASLSYEVHQVLRNQLEFEGLIITDDLDMSAISKYFSPEKAAIIAIQAGNDLICSSNISVQIPAIIDALENKSLDIEKIDNAVLRILIYKLKLGIIPS